MYYDEQIQSKCNYLFTRCEKDKNRESVKLSKINNILIFKHRIPEYWHKQHLEGLSDASPFHCY